MVCGVPLSILYPPSLSHLLPQTRKTAGWLAGELSREGHQVALLSGEMQVEQRAAVIDRFREGKEKVLVTTNVCARGNSTNQTIGVYLKAQSVKFPDGFDPVY